MENLDTIPGNPVTLVRQVSRQRGARVCRIVAELPQPVHFPFPADWHRRFAIYGPRSAADYPTNRTANRPFLIRQSIIVKCSCLVYFLLFPLIFQIFWSAIFMLQDFCFSHRSSDYGCDYSGYVVACRW